MSHFRKIIFFIVVVLAITSLSSMSFCSAESFKLKLEKEIGFSSYQQVVREKRVVNLPESRANSLNSIFGKLVKASRRQRELTFSLTVVEDPEVNAFALPGGYVFINTGLLEFASNEGEVAGVLAHEVAHIDLQHGMKAISRAVGFSMLLQIVSLRTQNPEKTARAGALACSLAQNGYSREAEYQADRSGVGYMKAAGYSKTDLIHFFQKLDANNGSKNDFPVMQLISTHPPTSNRIKRIEAM